MASISAVLIVKDEEKRIESCLKALGWADEIVVVDSGSGDKTLEIASKFTDRIFHRPFDNFSNQKNFAIDQAKGEWIFSVDADEIVSPGLARFLKETASNGAAADGYWVLRSNYIFGKKLRSQKGASEKILRFFRKNKGRFEQPIHERVMVNGPVSEARGELIHASMGTLDDYLQKLNLYTGFEARFMAERGVRPNILNFTVLPFARFVYFYFFRLGFLDGYPGFLYHALSSFYYFLKYAKLKEIYESPDRRS